MTEINMLREEILQSCSKTGVNFNETFEAISTFIENEQIVDYITFEGPGFNDPSLVLDIFILTKQVLINYSAYKRYSSLTNEFIKNITKISFITLFDIKPPSTAKYLINVLLTGEPKGSTIFGKESDYPRMRKFFINLNKL